MDQLIIIPRRGIAWTVQEGKRLEAPTLIDLPKYKALLCWGANPGLEFDKKAQ